MDLLHIGHGIGVGFHEHPSIRLLDKKLITSNMVFNIEPLGVDPEAVGFGQELKVVVTDDGPKGLSDVTDVSKMHVIED